MHAYGFLQPILRYVTAVVCAVTIATQVHVVTAQKQANKPNYSIVNKILGSEIMVH